MSINKDQTEMLNLLGVKDKLELFSDVPKSVRKSSFRMNRGISEHEVLLEARSNAALNRGPEMLNFLGNGIYDRIIPASVDSIVGRTEFLTSYTPYQAEMSQGVLQSLFEYQSMMCQLTGMDVTNSSMYDGYTALGEAVRMAYRINGKTELLVPECMYDGKLQVIKSYLEGLPVKIKKYAMDPGTGFMNLDDLKSSVNGNTCAIICEMPNGLGIIDQNITKVQEIKGEALLIAYVDPISLGILRAPGEYNADIAVAEGQQLGIHMSYGGPLLGILSFKRDYIRKSPGRLIGETVDVNGKRAFVMTLQTREQHIRREKAMSNICTNQALMAITAAAYLGIVGPDGLRKIGSLTYKNANDLGNTLRGMKSAAKDQLTGKSFSDVLIRFNSDQGNLQEKLLCKEVLGGISLAGICAPVEKTFPHSHFFSVTEKTTAAEIEKLASILEGI
ncbi:MAG: aminomethyl-transferring glycine dehydrogenase subunit GcvPA [Candidatus Thermoplasmatota archaeon]|nr:aminomethyl-transferring glycine dehydrogenase subunit GcvPA [Candidatus Thermoplasmatota archaeon]